MADFGENYRGGRKFTICPLCHLHFDSQFLLLQCPIVRKEIGKYRNLDDVYGDNISIESVKMLSKAVSVRNQLLS